MTSCAIFAATPCIPTLRLLDELGLGERFARLPFSKLRRGTFESNGHSVTYLDFERLRQPHRYIAMVPQWDLLNLLAEAARAEPSFTLRMRSEVTGLLRDGGRVVGVRYDGPDGPGELRAELTVACDGRWSIVRQEAGLTAHEYSVNFDVWWFKLPRDGAADHSFLPRIGSGKALAVIPREGYNQIAYLGPKGGDAQLRARGSRPSAATWVRCCPTCPSQWRRSNPWTRSSTSTCA